VQLAPSRVDLDFFAGIAVTADILLVLGLIGAIFDIINGAIQRDKLRDAINSLFESRLKIKRVLTHLDNLYLWMPIFENVYLAFDKSGYTQDAIISLLQTTDLGKPVQADLKDETFYAIARDLRVMDEGRGSWINEDPNWEDLARRLQSQEPARSASISATAHEKVDIAVQASPNTAVLANGKPKSTVDSAQLRAELDVTLVPSKRCHVSEFLCGTLKLSIQRIIDDFSAEAVTGCRNMKHAVATKGKMQLVLSNQDTETWIVSFADKGNSTRFKGVSPTPDTKVDLVLFSSSRKKYLVADGSLVKDRSLATTFIASYANFPDETPALVSQIPN